MEQVKQKDDIVRMFNYLNSKTKNCELFSALVNNQDVYNLHIAGLTLPSNLILCRIDGRRGYGKESFELVLLDKEMKLVLYYLFVTPSYQVIFEGRNVMQAFSWRTLIPGNEEEISSVCGYLFDTYLLTLHRIAVTAINAEIEGMVFWTKRILSALRQGHTAYAYDIATAECFHIRDERSMLEEWTLWLWQDKERAGNRVALLG